MAVKIDPTVSVLRPYIINSFTDDPFFVAMTNEQDYIDVPGETDQPVGDGFIVGHFFAVELALEKLNELKEELTYKTSWKSVAINASFAVISSGTTAMSLLLPTSGYLLLAFKICLVVVSVLALAKSCSALYLSCSALYINRENYDKNSEDLQTITRYLSEIQAGFYREDTREVLSYTGVIFTYPAYKPAHEQ